MLFFHLGDPTARIQPWKYRYQDAQLASLIQRFDILFVSLHAEFRKVLFSEVAMTCI